MAHINLQKIVSVKGQPGLFHLANYNPKGYFLQPFKGGPVRFFSNEKGKVLAIGNVDLKLKEGSINSLDIFLKMKDTTVLPSEASNELMVSFFMELFPDLDPAVAPSHLEKILKWYHQIFEHEDSSEMINEEDAGLTIA
jgi:hypothetical protein